MYKIIITTQDKQTLTFNDWEDLDNVARDSVLHSFNDHPSYIVYKDQIMICQMWHSNDMMHREGYEPAIIEYFLNGTIKEQSWWIDNKVHRDDYHPAVIGYQRDQTIEFQEWWINGEEYGEDEYLNFLKEIDKTDLILQLTDSNDWIRKRATNLNKIKNKL